MRGIWPWNWLGVGSMWSQSISSEQMLERTRKNAAAAGVGPRVQAVLADATDIPLADGKFDVAVAVGLLPWVGDAQRSLCETVRLVKPGGYVLLTTDNRYGISRVLDPAWHPRARAAIRRIRRRLGQSPRRWDPGPVSHSWSQTNSLLAAQGLRVVRRAGIGFGPFTFLFKQVLPESISLGLERVLQGLADMPSSPLWQVSLFHAVASQKSYTPPGNCAAGIGSTDRPRV